MHDLAVSKLAAGREKDMDYLAALFRHALARPETVRERLGHTPFSSAERRQLAEARLARLSGTV